MKNTMPAPNVVPRKGIINPEKIINYLLVSRQQTILWLSY
jgi:hypothetical protein